MTKDELRRCEQMARSTATDKDWISDVRFAVLGLVREIERLQAKVEHLKPLARQAANDDMQQHGNPMRGYWPYGVP